ncbi:MAG: tetratricopeptide repeat protein [Planctomycetota bacterium]
MKLRQEQIVFLVVFLLLGFLSYRLLTGAASTRRGGGGGEPAELERYPSPELDAVLRGADGLRVLQRDLLAPPSDTRPLPPLGIVEPPRAALTSLFPPPEPGPAPAAFGELLRLDLGLDGDPDAFADLFAEVDTGLGDVDYDDFELFRDRGGEEKPTSLIQDVRDAAGAQDDDPFAELTAQEIDLILQGYKQSYDWYWDEVRVTFGRIQNKDRWGLKTDPTRAEEPLLFTELLPAEGGVEKFKGMDPIAVDRDVVADWDFAGTFGNRIEVRRRELGDSVSRSTYNDAMNLAADCVRGRLEAARALEIAEELYRMCSAFDADDPAPRLGLARCFEAGFAFEQAFDEYNRILDQFAHRAEVHARLGALEARFFLFDQAEERLRHGVSVDRSSWEAQWELGRFLVARRRPAEAFEHLEKAASSPALNSPDLINERVEIRVDLAGARLARGEVADAHTLFGRALSTDPGNQRARAGWIATELLKGDEGLNGSATPPEASVDDDVGLELLLARGLAALADGDLATAKDQLSAAADADPLRANLAWRALSYVAESAGYPGEAQRYVELALECDPTDAWTLYQSGRLLALEEDFPGARAAFLRALDQDLDFVDALAALGEMSFKMGDFEDAERFLDRAVMLEPGRVAVHSLRGLNFLLLESPPEARASFESGLSIASRDPVCRAGVAWCTYLAGDSEQAMVQLRELDDSLRSLPDDDPMRIWARSNIERIQDHEQKVEWSDSFERKSIRNDWDYRESAGPVHRIVDGEVTLEGTFETTGATMLFRPINATLFVAVEADVWIDPATKADVGLFLARERSRSTSRETLAEVSVSRHHDGSLQVGVLRQGQSPQVTDMEQPFPTGQWVRLRLERVGDDSDTSVTLLADGVPLIEDAPFASLRSSAEILVGFRAEGEPGRQVKAKLDNYKLIYREGIR